MLRRIYDAVATVINMLWPSGRGRLGGKPFKQGAAYIAALQLTLLESLSDSLPEELEDLIFTFIMPMRTPSFCVKSSHCFLPYHLRPIPSNDSTGLNAPLVFGGEMPENRGMVYHSYPGSMVAHAAPVTPFIYSENICCISDGHLLYYDDYVYKNTVCRIDILQETSPIIQFRFYDEIRQVKPASGYVFVLLRESDELYMIVNDDYTYITRLPEVPMYTHTDVFLDALVYDGEVTQVLYNPDGQHLCIWRPCFDEIFRAKVPGPCTCRFVPGTNGTVVAGVFTRTCNYEERRWFNAFHIYDGLVPAKGVPVGPGIVVSVIISLSCILLVKVVLYQREVKQGRVETYAFDSQWRLPLGPDPRPLEEDDVADIYPPGFEFYSANHPYNRCSIKYSADRKMIEYIKEPDYSSSQFDSDDDDDDDDDEWAYYE